MKKPLSVRESFALWWRVRGLELALRHLSSGGEYEMCCAVWEAGWRSGVRHARYHKDARGRVRRTRTRG